MRRTPVVLAAVALLLLLALRRWLIPVSATSRQPAANFRWRTSQFGRETEGFARPAVPCGARVLVAHEQHLQAVGSDVRLLWLLRQLRALDAEVSLLLRAATPAARRSPPTAEVAALLGAASDVAHVLRDNATAPTPPALYELGDSAALAALLGDGHFDLVLLGVWFWYDPQPAFAELLLPVIQAYAEWRPPCDATDSCAAAAAGPDDDGGDAAAASGRRRHRPAVALLLDDAHAERAARLAAEETDGASARTYLAQSRNFGARTRQIYAAADLLLYLTATDMAADAPQRGGLARGLRMDARLLRMPAQVGVLPGSDDNTTAATPTAAAAPAGPRIGFVGDGRTPTNYLGLQRFLREGWPVLRSLSPRARLRIVGREPDAHRPGERPRGGRRRCAAGEVHCGWAWSTPCEANTSACGVDALGYLSAAALRREAARWQLLVVPIFASTGANTKVLLGLQLGLPIVATPAAVAPFGLRPGTAAAALADNASALAHAAAALLADAPARRRLGRAARAHFGRLLNRSDAADDAAALVRWSCIRVSSRAGPRAPPVVAAAEGIEEDEEVVNGGGADYCGLRARTLAVYTCGTAALWPEAWRIAAVWQSVCDFCGLRCVDRTAAGGGARCDAPPPPNATAPPAVLLLGDDCCAVGGGGGGVRRVGFAWEPSKGRTLYHQRGARLGAMVRSEALAAALGPRAVARVSQMNSARGYREGWAAAFAAAGFAPGGVAQLLRGPAKAGQRNFTGAMREHLGGGTSGTLA